MKRITLFLISFMLLASTAFSKNVYVNPTNGDDITGDGLLWSTAVKSLATAATIAATDDNIYVKGGTLDFTAAFTAMTTVNYYGGCQGGETDNTTTPARPLIDQDGNGIIEPWEFQYPTLLSSTLSVTNSGSTAFTFANSTYTFNGFTLTHVGSSTGTGLLKSFTTSSTFTNNTIKNCNVTATSASYSITAIPYEIFFKSSGNMTNCLFDKNTFNYVGTAVKTVNPFIALSPGSATSNCIIRNNIVTLTYANVANPSNSVRGVLVSIAPGASATSASLKNCIIHNNEMIYDPSGTSPATLTTGGAVYIYFAAAPVYANVINCTIANNKATNLASAGLYIYGSALPSYYINNNVLWNNKVGTTVSNFVIPASLSSTSLINNNVMNGGSTGGITADNGTTLINNDYTLDDTNTTGNAPKFSAPTAAVGNLVDGTVETSVWKLNSGSYLIAKGAVNANNLTDKSGITFETPRSVGAYQYETPVPTALLSFNSDLNIISMARDGFIANFSGKIQVYTVAGQQLRNANVLAGTKITLSSGIYLVRSTSAKGSSTQKIIL